MSLRLLGGFQLELPSRALALPAKKAQALLAYLALRPGRPHARETLMALLWGDVGEKQARQSLRQTVFRVRQVFATARNPGFVVRAETIAVNPSAIDVDVVTFERLVRKGTAAALATAVACYDGPLLDGLRVNEAPFEDWLRGERERLRELAEEALAKLLAQQVRSGPVETAMQTAARLLALDPLQESAHRTLMRLYARHARRAAALRQYQTCVAVLRRELGVEPEAETQRLYQEILQQQAKPSTALRVCVSPAETPLVGRQPELAQLRRALRDIRRSQGRVVLLTGEAGIGKSRLIQEVGAEASRQGYRMLLAHAYESEQILPFRPWVDAIRAGAILAEAGLLEPWPPSWRGELTRLFPELGTAGAQPPITPESYVRLFEVIDALVAQVAGQRPLVLALEDLHWADELSLRLFSFIGRRARDRALLLIGTAREEELPDAPVLRRLLHELAPEAHVDHVGLSTLSEQSTTGLVGALARVGSSRSGVADLAQKVWAMSGGNPFVIVETMRALQEKRRLNPTGLSLPHRVREVLTARLERLSATSRALVAVASVIERDFSFAVLQQGSGLKRSETAEGIEELVRRRILHAIGERFDFTHAWIRSVVYEGLVTPRRQALHAAVGEALESVHAEQLDELDDRLAYHFARADEPARAFGYLLRLADRAARRYAVEEAVRILRDARGYVDRLPAEERDRQDLDLVYRLAHSLLLLGRSAEARDLLAKEETRIDRLRDPALSGPYYFWLAYTDSNLGDSERAMHEGQRALEEAARCADELTMGQANSELSLLSYLLGRPLEGIAHGRQAVALLERTDERWWLGRAHWPLAMNLLHIGDFAAALETFARMRTIGEAIGDTRLQSQATAYSGRIYGLTGEYETAIALACRASELAADPVSRASATALLGTAYAEKGDADHAIPTIEEALEHFERLGERGGYRNRQHVAFLTPALSEMYLRKGDVSRAAELAQRALSVAAAAAWPVAIGYAERSLGCVAQAGGDQAGAGAHFVRAVEVFASVDARFQVARMRLLLAELLHRSGAEESAATQLKEAYDVFRRLHVPVYVERTERLATELGLSPG